MCICEIKNHFHICLNVEVICWMFAMSCFVIVFFYILLVQNRPQSPRRAVPHRTMSTIMTHLVEPSKLKTAVVKSPFSSSFSVSNWNAINKHLVYKFWKQTCIFSLKVLSDSQSFERPLAMTDTIWNEITWNNKFDMSWNYWHDKTWHDLTENHMI